MLFQHLRGSVSHCRNPVQRVTRVFSRVRPISPNMTEPHPAFTSQGHVMRQENVPKSDECSVFKRGKTEPRVNRIPQRFQHKITGQGHASLRVQPKKVVTFPCRQKHQIFFAHNQILFQRGVCERSEGVKRVISLSLFALEPRACGTVPQTGQIQHTLSTVRTHSQQLEVTMSNVLDAKILQARL